MVQNIGLSKSRKQWHKLHPMAQLAISIAYNIAHNVTGTPIDINNAEGGDSS